MQWSPRERENSTSAKGTPSVQQDPGSLDSFIEVVIWIGILIGLLGAMWLAWVLLRKWYFGGLNNDRNGVPWTLQDLRDLKERGELSEIEFETLRQQLIASYKDRSGDLDSGRVQGGDFDMKSL